MDPPKEKENGKKGIKQVATQRRLSKCPRGGP